MRPLRRTFAAAAAVAVSAALTLAGCSGSAPSSSASASKNATVRVGLVLEPTSLDIRTQAGAALDQVLIDNVYQGLVGRTPTEGIRDVLAKSHSVSADGLTYTFTLRSGLHFSNGDPLNAADAVWSLNDFRSHAATYINGADLSSVSGITAPDPTTVVITLSKPDSDLLFALSGRAGLILDQKATNNRATSAIGSGPYDLASWKQGDSLTFTRNTDYWGSQAKVAKVVFQYITDPSTEVAAMANGQLDVATNIDATLKGQLQGVSGVTLKTGRTTDKYTLAFNNRVAPLNDVRVRTALREAIDAKALIAAVGGAGVVQGGPIPALDPGYQNLDAIDAYNPTHAKQLLAQAGASGLHLTLTYPNIYPTTYGDILTSELAKVGVHLTVNRIDFATWLTQVFQKHDYQLSLVDHNEARDFGNWANPDYYFGYDNPTVQALYAQSLQATTTAQKDADLAKAAKIVSTDAAADWLFTATNITAIRDGITGFPTDSTSARLDLTNLQSK
ncbi:ABC transporter substrate-binding protein [Curtobacterium ammoniigenes]|uniref:ABC transporter substrate-binding protein n=1 Tax=Curtobacterium ammoniigenes TaxID=395387 RepID=UPI00082CA06F|nr:ABC transporter substrate-binding protein [Curtobacterium ammoniigenes]